MKRLKSWYKRHKAVLKSAKAWAGLVIAVIAIFLILSVTQYLLLGALGAVWLLIIVTVLKMKGKNG